MYDDEGRGMRTIHHVFTIVAPCETVFRALTTADGLAGWWTTEVRADEAAIGAYLTLSFGPFTPQLRISELEPPTRLRWEGAGGHGAWGDHTAIRFDLDATSGGTTVRFWHEPGSELSDDAVGAANFNWGYYLDSLRLLCEIGSGKPFPNGTPGARVGASAAR